MISNRQKFQATVVKKDAKMKDFCPFNINDLTINSENSVKLFGVEIDNKQKLMGFKEKEVCLNSFVYSKLNYCPLNIYIKSKKYKKGDLDYFTTTSLVIILNS